MVLCIIPPPSPYVDPTPSPTPSETIDEPISTPARYLTFRGESDNSSFGLNTIASGHKVYYSKDLRYWKRFNTTEDIEINDGEEAYVIGDADGVTFSGSNNTTFRMTGLIGVTGDITSILDYKTLNEKIAPYCYFFMFAFCASLTQAPALPATTLATSCYNQMFYGCTTLTQAPSLPATTLASGCYMSMFQNCTALTKAPALPATTLDSQCYQYMFYGCTSLTRSPALPATTLASYCYANMFFNCTSLTQAPTLPAVTLASSCYREMFYGCTALTKAPTLPASALVAYCYYYMFKGCTNLSSITCLATNISATNPTANWLSDVATIGTFTKPASMTSWTNGPSGIPDGWTVVDYTN